MHHSHMDRRKYIRRGFSLLHSCSKAIGCKTRMGFSLIEAAIVLAIVGLVVAGIWVAAATIKTTQRINEAKNAILLVSEKGRNVFPIENYPRRADMSEGLQVQNTLLAIGILPVSRFHVNIQVVIIKENDDSNPTISTLVFTTKYLNNPKYSDFTISDCTRLVKSIFPLVKNNHDFIGIHLQIIGGPGGEIEALYPTSDLSNFKCSDYTQIVAFSFNGNPRK